jgi:hypothetical protein
MADGMKKFKINLVAVSALIYFIGIVGFFGGWLIFVLYFMDSKMGPIPDPFQTIRNISLGVMCIGYFSTIIAYLITHLNLRQTLLTLVAGLGSFLGFLLIMKADRLAMRSSILITIYEFVPIILFMLSQIPFILLAMDLGIRSRKK